MTADQKSFHAGTDIFRSEHAQALLQLASDPAVRATKLAPHSLSMDAAHEFIERCARERAADQSFVHAVMDRRTLVGLCGLLKVAPRATAELEFWIGQPFRGKGLATFAVGNMMDFAFGPLRLERVCCRVPEENLAARHILEQHGFRFIRTELCPKREGTSGAALAFYEVTRAEYRERKNAPFLRDLCSDLKPILEAELAAGNEIGECSRGWPEKDSIIIALRKPFRPPTPPLPANIQYREVNDTHWWKAEYATTKPVHLLTCGFA